MLKKPVLIIATASALAAQASVAHAAPAHEKATGEVTWEEDGASHVVSFNAFDYGAEGDRGTLTYSNLDAGFTYTAQIDRVAVTEGVACFQYAIPVGSDAPDAIEGVVVTFQVIDSGTPSSTADQIGYQSSRSETVAATDFGSCGFAQSETTSGNLVVH